jgi:hypothetical protein
MAMSNKERQAKWRAKLKSMAASAPRLEDLLREHMRAFLLEQASTYMLTPEEEEIYLQAMEALLARGDGPLIAALDAVTRELHEKEINALFHARRSEAPVAKGQKRGSE